MHLLDYGNKSLSIVKITKNNFYKFIRDVDLIKFQACIITKFIRNITKENND
jgi:hypothetical protein